VTAAAVGLLLAASWATGYLWYALRARRLASERLETLIGPADVDNMQGEELPRASKAFPPRRRFLPAFAGTIAAATLWLGARLPIEVAGAAGVLVGVLSHLAEEHLAGQRTATIEMQLAEAIDLLVGSLRAGSSLLAAFESALEESEPPLRPYLQEVAGRIRLGDDPLVSNRTGGLPATVISPSLLFDELQVKRADTSKDKLPEYPAPPLQ